MARLKFFISVFFITCFLSSCSIEKRVYLRGFHVERKHKKENGTTASLTSIVEENRTVNLLLAEKSGEESDSANQVYPVNEPAGLSLNEKPVPAKKDSLKTKAEKINRKTIPAKKKDPEETEKTNILAVLSAVISLLTLPVMILCFAVNFSLFLMLFALMALGALVLGLLALSQMKKNSKLYPNTVWAKFGIIFSIIELSIALVAAAVWTILSAL